MMEWVLVKPKRLIELGKFLFGAGFVLAVLGLFGQVAVKTTGIVQTMANQSLAQSLADLYPTLPTWFVPETAFGAVITVLLLVSGVVAQMQGKRLIRAGF